MRHHPERVTLLIDSNSTTAPATMMERIRDTFTSLTQTMKIDDQLFIFLIGHGSYQRDVSKFILTGPDLTPDELDKLIGALPAGRIGLVNAASASAGFINALSGNERVVVTGTRNVDQRNATEFMEYFIQGLERGKADQNRDERISMLEACRYADVLTEAFYVGEGLIQTENALIDDNGDRRGTRLAQLNATGDLLAYAPEPETQKPENLDGALADRMWLRDYIFPDSVPEELIGKYLAKLAEIEDWKRQKTEMEIDPYYGRLERLLIEAARLNRDIRKYD
jgi:hypothetical protein